MKKFFFALLAIIVFNVASFAQVTTKTKTTVKAPKMETKAKVKTTATQEKTTATTEKTVKLKKDGTADMRYKENKQKKVEVTTGPKKKDGTPDMRYKANKKS